MCVRDFDLTDKQTSDKLKVAIEKEVRLTNSRVPRDLYNEWKFVNRGNFHQNKSQSDTIKFIQNIYIKYNQHNIQYHLVQFQCLVFLLDKEDHSSMIFSSFVFIRGFRFQQLWSTQIFLSWNMVSHTHS